MSTLAARRREADEFRRNERVRRSHRRAIRWRIVGPVIVAILLMIALVAAMIVGFSDRQVGITANFMTLLLLIPTVLACFVPYILLVVVVVWTGRLYRWVPPKMRIARNLAHSMTTGTQRLANAISRPVIRLNERFAWAENVVKQITDGQSSKEGENDGTSA